MAKKYSINVFNDTRHKHLPRKLLAEVARRVMSKENIATAELNIILTNDDNISKINFDYLGHDGPTDVISFNLSEGILTGEIYISIDTAKVNAMAYKVSITNELKRLTAHGTLHIIGYDDDTPENKSRMTELENKYINF